MAFFDNLSKKATEAGQKAVQKTKDLTDLTKLNSSISEEEKAINNTYTNIGKLYVSLHRDDYEENFADLINAFKDSEAKINLYKQQINDIKGVQRCEKCGAENPSGTAFCSSCGAPMPKAAAPEPAADPDTVQCGNCGAVMKKGMAFCTSCGSPLTQKEPEAAAPSQPAEAQEKVCPVCGAKVEGNVAFCIQCGTKLEQ